MIKESYERLLIDVTKFDIEDVITTSGQEPTPPIPGLHFGPNEMGTSSSAGIPFGM